MPDTSDLSLFSPEELAAYEEALQLQVHLTSPLDYALHVSEATERYAHVELLNRHIVALVEHRLYPSGTATDVAVPDAEGVLRHPQTGEPVCEWLDISMPPRHGKSYLVSEHTPPWFITKYPEKRVILTSYEAEFAKSWGRKSRQHIERHPAFGVRISDESRAADHWEVEGHRGGMQTAGAGGAITGKGADLLIIDDPVKNAEDALSDTQRKKLWDWFKSTVDTRLEPGAVGILMATRWHEDDLIGRATKGGPINHYVLNLPALAWDDTDASGVSIDPDTRKPDPLGRKPGEALCPERYSAASLIQRRDGAELSGAALEDGEMAGKYWFNALYQGRPQVEGGGIISRPFCYYAPHMPRSGEPYRLYDADGALARTVYASECFRFATLDLAASTKTSADWTVFSVWDVTPLRDVILHDRVRVRMETPDHAPQVREWAKAYGVKYVGVESATFGMSLIQQLMREGGVSVRPLKADKDKVTRAIPYGNHIAMGKVFFPKGAPWIQDWEDEHVKFPNAKHDDQVDTGSYAIEQVLLMPVKNPQYRTGLTEGTAEYRAQRHLEERLDKRSKNRPKVHPVLGRWR